MNLLTITESARVDLSSYQALHVAAHLHKRGQPVSLMCPEDSQICRESPKYDIASKALTPWRRMGFFGGRRFDIINYYDPGPLQPLLLKRLAARSKIFISKVALGTPESMGRLKRLEPYVSRFVASCPSVQQDLRAAGIDAARTFIVPPGINTGRWESAMLIKHAMFAKRPFKVGTVSMDTTLEEQGLFLRAAKEVLKSLPDTNFMVVGLKDERIRAMARDLGISHKVDVLWEREDMPEVMAMMHIFVKTNTRAGLSMSLVEAQASGVACIVPRVRGLSDHVVHERNGILAEPGDVRSFAEAIAGLINNTDLCQSISKAAFDQVNLNMSMPVVTNLMYQLYEEALAG